MAPARASRLYAFLRVSVQRGRLVAWMHDAHAVYNAPNVGIASSRRMGGTCSRNRAMVMTLSSERMAHGVRAPIVHCGHNPAHLCMPSSVSWFGKP